MLLNEWDDFDTAAQSRILHTVIDSIYVKKGHAQKGDPIEDRVLIRWAGEDVFERPRRGTTKYKTTPVLWPPDGMLPLANVPEWAVRVGHPALPEALREEIHEEARKDGLHWYLPADEGGRARERQ